MTPLIRDLCESKLFPSLATLDRKTPAEVAEITYLYLLALRIMLHEDEVRHWTKSYAQKSAQWGNFSLWRSNGTDLYVLLHALQVRGKDEEHGVYPINHAQVLQWLRNASHGRSDEALVRRIFMRLDFDLRVRHESMRSLRRLIMDWPNLTDYHKRLAVTRLLQFLRSRAPRSEVLVMFDRLADVKDFEIGGVCNMETGEGCGPDDTPKKRSFLSFLTRKK
jgi:hypothetical protein